MKKKISITISEKTLSDIDSIIDNIYIRNRSQAIELLINQALGDNKVAVILFGGEEKKLQIDKETYRITAVIDNMTLIEHGLIKLKEEGFTEIYVVARHNIITSIFNLVHNGSGYGVNINYIEEKSSKGTADSLYLLRGKITTNFLVVYGDLVFDQINLDELWNTHLKRKGITTLLLTTTPTPTKKGIVNIEGARILEFVQKPKESDVYIGFSSIFISTPDLFEYAGESLERDVFPVLAKKGLLYGHLSTNKEMHIHTKKDIEKARQLLTKTA